jgi:BirA family biotin operon repressor/biotin-[acetyl-CoA-carboxylase] ligase
VDATRLRSLLGHGCHLVVLDSTTTTNDEVLVQARALARSVTLRELVPLVVVSGQQTAGRGRLGRSWTSPFGGVYLSVLTEVTRPTEARGQRVTNDPSSSALFMASLSPLTALAVHGALQSFSSRRLFIKWPNDLVSEQGKLAGILVEVRRGDTVFDGARGSLSDSSLSSLAVIGVGINVNRPPEGAFAGASYLDEGTGCGLDLEAVAAAAIDGILTCHERWLDGGCCFAPFVAEYRQHMALLGEPVCVRDATGAEMASGSVEGVDDEGQLLVATARGVVTIAAGEVTLRDF